MPPPNSPFYTLSNFTLNTTTFTPAPFPPSALAT
jgi:hypothetical protein